MIYVLVLLLLLVVNVFSQFYEDPLLSSSVVQSTGTNNNHDGKNNLYLAEQYYKTGMDYAQNKNDFTTALANLRAAVRLNPFNEIYQNDLGVSEMRVGQLHKAKRRFIESLRANKYYSTAQENIDDLKAFMGIKEYMKGLLDEDKRLINRNPDKINIKHTLLDINEVSPADYIYYCGGLYAYDINDFCDKTDEKEQERIQKCDELMSMPLLIKDAASVWGWNLEVFEYNNLLSTHGSVRVDYYPHGMSEETVKPFFSTLSDAPFLPNVPIFHVDASLPGTYIHWNMKVTDWNEIMKNANATIPSRFDDKNWMDQCLVDDVYKDDYAIKTHWKMILIGEKGAGMFNHKDTLRTSSWQMQVEGRKKWHLCPNTETPLLGKAGEIDVFQPDYEYYPNAWKLECYQVIVEPGDFIYYPKDFWHQTLALDTPTVSISGTMVDELNYPGVTDELKKECVKKEAKIFIAEQTMCEYLEKCYRFWSDNFN